LKHSSTTALYTLSLHDALPIWPEAMERISAGKLERADVPVRKEASLVLYLVSPDYALRAGPQYDFSLERGAIEADGVHVFFSSRSEEHTSELQSPCNLVCRLLL